MEGDMTVNFGLGKMDPYGHHQPPNQGRNVATGAAQGGGGARSLTSAEHMREYQAFMAAVRAEIDRMVRSGYRREEAVETLLRRIKSLSSGADGVPAIPTEREVSALMRSHQLSLEDATRALVVRNAVSCLRKKGWDSASVMKQLTCTVYNAEAQGEAVHTAMRPGVKRPFNSMGVSGGGHGEESEGDDMAEEQVYVSRSTSPSCRKRPCVRHEGCVTGGGAGPGRGGLMVRGQGLMGTGEGMEEQSATGHPYGLPQCQDEGMPW